MTVCFAIETPIDLAGNGGTSEARCSRIVNPARPGTEMPATPPIGGGDPAVAIRGPERFLPIAPAQRRRALYRLVDTLVTFAVIGGFAAALVGMAGEFHRGSSSPATSATEADATGPLTPHVATSTGASLPTGPRAV